MILGQAWLLNLIFTRTLWERYFYFILETRKLKYKEAKLKSDWLVGMQSLIFIKVWFKPFSASVFLSVKKG